MTRLARTQLSAQKGAVLAGSLIFLLVLSVLGASTLTASSAGERVIQNLQESELSVQAADSVMREVESIIDSKITSLNLSAQPGWYAKGQAPDPYTLSTWQSSASVPVNASYSKQPLRYFIEIMGDYEIGNKDISVSGYGVSSVATTKITIFRVVTYSPGETGHARIMIETYYGKIF